MGLTVKEAAKYLNVSESAVRKLVSSGKLETGQEGHRVLIEQSSLEALRGEGESPGADPVSGALADGEQDPGAANGEKPPIEEPVPLETGRKSGAPKQTSFSDAVVRPVLERLTALEEDLSEKFGFLEENRRLFSEIRRIEQELSKRDHELERLQQDLVYQKRLFEKEIQDYARLLDEKWAVREQETEDRLERQSEEFEQRLEIERNIWSEKLDREQERSAAALAEAQRRQGLWSRFVRMLTWS